MQCLDCAEPLYREGKRGSPRCEPCRRTHNREVHRACHQKWSRENREQRNLYFRRYYRRKRIEAGLPTRKEYQAAVHARMMEAGTHAKMLWEKGATYSEIAVELGLTRNAVAGLICRVRRVSGERR